MYCVKCGAKLEGNPKFCYACGQPVPEQLQASARPPAETLYQPPPGPAPVPPPKRKRRWPRRLLTCGTILLGLLLILALVIGGAYFLFGLHRTNLTAKVVPDDAAALMVIRPNPLQLASARQVEDLFSWVAIAAALPDMADIAGTLDNAALLDLKIDPQDDLLPWIGGEIGLALLYGEGSMRYTGAQGGLAAPAERPPAASSGPPFVLTAATRSEKRSDLFLADIRAQWEGNGVQFSDWTYEGVNVAEIVSPGHPPLAYATVDRVVMVGSDAETLESAIDRALGRVTRSLGNEQLFQTLVDDLPANRLGALYLDWNTLREYMGISDGELPFGIAKGVEMAAIAPSLTRDGLRLNYVLSYDTRQLSPAERELLRQAPGDHRLTAAIPVESVALISGQNAQASWDAIWFNVEGGFADLEDDLLRSLDRRMSRSDAENQLLTLVERETGINLKDDLIANLIGEYAVALVPVSDGGLNRQAIPAALVVLAEIEDQPQVERTMHDLASLIARKRNLDFFREQVRGTDVWMMEDRTRANPFGFGFIDDRLFLATSYEAFELIIRARDAPLAGADLFEQATKPWPPDGRWGWYLDVDGALDMVSQMIDEDEWDELDRAIAGQLESIHAISAAAGPLDDNGLVHGVVFIGMD